MTSCRRYGAVMSIRNCATPISIARSVMEKCPHNILCGDGALEWAVKFGYNPTDILTATSRKQWEDWQEKRITQNGRIEQLFSTNYAIYLIFIYSPDGLS